ncbi:capsule biosynthesis protein [Rhizobium sp. SG2393]|uniref:capsule biosynthesis protein n=1 Tax=Rhizobium sp. SG2393 TaxID=3276279 RepID=UPI003671D918
MSEAPRTETPPAARTFLFLEGPSSLLFVYIARALEKRGHRCLRINLNAGDQIFWRHGGATAYRGTAANWPGFVERFMLLNRVDELILLGEERPYHQAACAAARRNGVRISVVEMGYLRPDWITIEREGMSSNSRFPRDPAQILAAAEGLPEPDWTRRYSQTFVADAGLDLVYNLPNVFLWFLYPHYRRHAIFHPLAEYVGWIRRLATGKRRAATAQARIDRLLESERPFFVYPLQLETDFQLRAHSPYHSQKQAIDEILSSFAAHAPADTTLVIKVHPLDNDLIDWEAYAKARAEALGISHRILYLDGGDLALLLGRSQGVVTVNSTVGLHAYQQAVPVKVLGSAVFDVEGLSDQRPLDVFWAEPHQPDPVLLSAFLRLMAATIQVRGNFYSLEGARAGAEAIAARLDARDVNEPGAYVDPAPRRKPVKRAWPQGLS